MKIAIHGKAGSGKDTMVDYMISKYGGTKIAFSDPIYEIMHYAQNVCGFDKEKDRKFLQIVGTEWARNKDPNVWVNIALQRAKKIDENVYVTDIRFINEYEAIKNDKDWLVVKIKRDDELIENNRIGSGDCNHISENGLDDSLFNIIIYNNSTLENFYKQIDNLFKNNFYYFL